MKPHGNFGHPNSCSRHENAHSTASSAFQSIDLNEMARQQEVGNAFLDSVLVATVLANQLALLDLSLQEEMVQILQSLGILLKGLSGRRLLRQLRETELCPSLAKKKLC